MSEAAVTTSTAEVSTPNTGTEISTGGQAEAAPAPTTEAQIQEIAELAEGDFDKLIPVKGADGQVRKVKLRDFVIDSKKNEVRAKKAAEAIEQRVGATVKELVAFAKANPKDFMSRIGVNPEEFAEMTLTEKVKALEMTPEQKRIAEYEAELKRYKDEDAQRKEHETKSRSEQEYAKEVQRLDTELADAFSKSGLPRSKFYLQQAVAVMSNDLTRYQTEMERDGFASRDPLSAEEALGIVKQSVPNHIKETLNQMDVHQIRQLLGSDVLEKIRQDDIQRVQHQNTKKTPSTGTPPKKEKEPVFTKDSDYRAWVESRKQ